MKEKEGLLEPLNNFNCCKFLSGCKKKKKNGFKTFYRLLARTKFLVNGAYPEFEQTITTSEAEIAS